jgi:hypothetical protein
MHAVSVSRAKLGLPMMKTAAKYKANISWMMDDSTEQKNDTGDADHRFQEPYSNITQRFTWEHVLGKA